MRKLMTVLLALGLVGVLYAEEVDLVREAVEAANAITGDVEARMDAMDAAGAEYGPAALAKLRAGEGITYYEGVALNWHVRNEGRNRVDLELLREVLDIRPAIGGLNRRLALTLARQPEVDDAEVIAAVEHFTPIRRHVTRAVNHRAWDSPEGRNAFISEWIEPRLAQGGLGVAYKFMFRRYVQDLPAAKAVPVLEDAIRAALTRSPSDTRDAWIKELRAQHVILRDLAGD